MIESTNVCSIECTQHCAACSIACVSVLWRARLAASSLHHTVTVTHTYRNRDVGTVQDMRGKVAVASAADAASAGAAGHLAPLRAGTENLNQS